MKEIEFIFSKRIDWQALPVRQGESDPHWYAYVDGERWGLRLNDFPDEPLFTLIVGERAIDLESRPPTWTLPRTPS